MTTDKNIQPFYAGGNPSFPLSGTPYYSRTEDKNINIGIDGDEVSNNQNYQFVAFRPGFSLQASELNEMQENMQMQMSLSINMMHNWITNRNGYLWEGYDGQSPAGEGSAWTAGATMDAPATGIGFGGSMMSENVSGPGWRGATPLYPFKSPYKTISGDGSLVKIAPNGTDTDKLDVTIGSGWWLVEVMDTWDGNEDNQPQGVSGLKHWVFLEESFTVEKAINTGDTNKYIVFGLDISSHYIECCSDEADCDADLADNASGVSNSASCGASRYALRINSQLPSVSTNDDGNFDNAGIKNREKQNSVFVVNTEEKTIRYMNNLLIYKWG
jgi:hypothetical protein